LRRRILASAGRERPARAPLWPVLRRVRSTGFVLAALGAAVVLLSVTSLGEYRALQTAHEEKAKLQEVATADRSWYMSAAGAEWTGSGGTLVARQDGSARVLFHDLKPVGEGAQYALWLVSAEGRWTRGATFKPDGQKLQTVEVTANVGAGAAIARCLVTVDEGTNARPPAQPVVMQWTAK
ncbi:MAG: anti-sigma factor, partial [Chloroflexi bacterium]|nr:anti-sigma factor [Chloroflexota bacterium]